jgi:hypothetical protein
MRAKTTLLLCCVLTLLLAGPALAAETGPALTLSGFDNAAPAPVCSAPAAQPAQADLGGGPEPEAACPVSVWQACYQRYGTCTLCFCLGSACECENRCV